MSFTDRFRTLVHTSGRTLRQPLRRSALSLLLALTLLAQPLALYAGTIEVDGTTCTLYEAVEVATSDVATGDCPIVAPVGGPDTLNLANTTHNIPAPPFVSTTAIPNITSNITINGNGATIERIGPEAYRLFFVAPNGDLTINDVTIQNFAPGEGGGAIYSKGAVTITGSIIFSNTAGNNGNGGAVLNENEAILTIRDSELQSNTAKFGGAIANYHTSVAILDDVTFRNNAAGDSGGVLDNYFDSTIVITNSRFFDNEAILNGGAIHNDGEDSEEENAVSIHNSKFGHNNAGSGGAIFNTTTAILTLRQSEVVSNTAALGAGIYITDATAIISNTTFSDNRALGSGGALYNWTNGQLTVTGGTIRGNNAEYGAGLGNHTDSTANVNNVTFINNKSSKDGGAIDNFDGSTLAITDSAFLNNTAGEMGGAINNITSTLTLHNSQVSTSNAISGTVNNVAGTVTVSSSGIDHNSASNGGAFYNSAGAELTILNTEINNNSAVSGGAIVNELSSELTITNTTIFSNVAWGAGGIFNTSGSKATLDSVDFKGNVGVIVGGAISNFMQSSILIRDSTFITNATAYSGGGIYNSNQATLVVNNTIFSENRAMVGAAIVNTGTSTVTVTASSFLSNTAGVGGALYNGRASKATLSGVKLIANEGLSDTLAGGIFASEQLNLPALASGEMAGQMSALEAFAPQLNAATSPDLTAQSSSAVSITNSCIIQNVVVAISAPESGFNSGGAVDATNNWWGSPYGPGGDGPGPGDFIEGNVTFEPFLTEPILNCPITAPFLSTQLPLLEKAQ